MMIEESVEDEVISGQGMPEIIKESPVKEEDDLAHTLLSVPVNELPPEIVMAASEAAAIGNDYDLREYGEIQITD